VTDLRLSFYMFTNIGALVGQIGMSYSAKYVGFWLAFTLPTAVFCLCPLVLLYGRNKYITSPPTGSVFATSLRVWRYAARGQWTWNPVRLFKNFGRDDFFEASKPSKVAAANNGEKPAWMTFDDQWVDEVRRGFLACKVFLWYPLWCKFHSSSI
jgi:POT family proton-dependent oligopeptide transporter